MAFRSGPLIVHGDRGGQFTRGFPNFISMIKSRYTLTVSLLILSLLMSSCYTRRAVVSGQTRNLHSGAVALRPAWDHKRSIFFWSLPIALATVGGVTGYSTGPLTTTNGQTFSKSQAAGVYGGLGGILGLYWLFKFGGNSLKKRNRSGVEVQDREKWLRKYNLDHSEKYIPVGDIMSSPLTIIPQQNLELYRAEQLRLDYESQIKNGDAAASRGRFDDARVSYERAQRLGYDDQRATKRLIGMQEQAFAYYLDQGDRFLLNKQFPKALTMYRKAEDLGFNDELVQQRLKKLREAQSGR